MANEKKNVDEAATAAFSALEKVTQGQPEGALAKVLLVALSYAAGTPWLAAAEPLLQRILERLTNKVGKDAVAAIAAEVKTEEGFRRIAAEVKGQIEPVLRELFAQQKTRGGADMGQVIEAVDSSVADAVGRLAILLHRMEERLASPTGLARAREPLISSLILTGPTASMHAVAVADGRVFERVRAVRYDANPRLILELTNMSKFDVRPIAIFVDVVECLDIHIEDVWMWYGMMRPIRKYGVRLEPRPGRYVCSAAEAGEDSYLAMSPGELELFSIVVTVPASQALYRARISVECSHAGEVFTQSFDRVVQFGTYDPQKYDASKSRRMEGPPPEDGGDTCIRDGQAVGMAIAANAARR